MAFLEILTRHHSGRPELLKRCEASLDAQTDLDWVQTLLIDDVGRGVFWANGNLGRYAPRLEGEYIWVLDDDDICICDTLIEDLKRTVAETCADVVMVRGEIHTHGIVPDDEHWGQIPEFANVAMPNFVLRRAVWQKHAGMLAVPRGADFRMIHDVFAAGVYRIEWLDKVVVRAEKARFGAIE